MAVELCYCSVTHQRAGRRSGTRERTSYQSKCSTTTRQL